MDTKLSRRQLLKAAGAAVLGASLGSCARRSSPSRHFAKVKVSPDRVIRTTVGLDIARLGVFDDIVERLLGRLMQGNCHIRGQYTVTVNGQRDWGIES